MNDNKDQATKVASTSDNSSNQAKVVVSEQSGPRHKWTEKSIEESSGFFNKLFFVWTDSIIRFGVKNIFQEKDLFEIRSDEKFEYAKNHFFFWYDKFKNYKNALNKSILKLVRLNFISSFFLQVFANLLQFAGPLLLKEILIFMVDRRKEDWQGYVYAVGMFVAFFLKAVLTQQGFHQINTLSFKTLSALEAHIVNKSLKLSTSARNFLDTGKVINLATVDTQGVFGFLQFMAFLYTAPFMIIVSIALIVWEVGAVGLVGLAVIIIGSLCNAIISAKIMILRGQTLRFSDQRSKAIAEYIAGIKIIKYYGWEQMAIDKIFEIRNKETSLLLSGAIWRAALDFFTNLVPIFISIAVFGLYIAEGNTLTPAKAFTTLAYFNLIQLPVRMFAFSLFFLVQTKISLNRLQSFTNWEEFEAYNETVSSFPVGKIHISDGEFAWETENARDQNKKFQALLNVGKRKGPPGAGGPGAKAGSPTKPGAGKPEEASPLKEEKKDLTILRDINLEINPGEFVAIIGQVGSGKSSILGSILGEMHKVKGSVKLNGKIAYVPQVAWLQNATLRDNIIFENDFDRDYYNKVLKICELEDDCKILPGQDMTEIGERGINLSGGQKQRVSIARAVYSKADIYIIDDALSALDAHVGRKIFDNVLTSELKGKTIVFVTHAMQYVANCHKIIVMKEGKVCEFGTPSQLAADPNSEFNRLCVNNKKEEVQDEDGDKIVDLADVDTLDPAAKDKLPGTRARSKSKKEGEEKKEAEQQTKGALSKDEERSVGSISWKVYQTYISSGGISLTLWSAFFFLISQGCRQVTDWWLSAWSGDYYDLPGGMYVLYYFIASVITGIAILFRGIIFGYFSRKVSITLQRKMLLAIFRSPMSWFDITPAGRILNRTSKDQDDVDVNLPWTVQFAIFSLLMVISTMIAIGIVTPLFFAFAFVFVIYYTWTLKRFMKGSRELKRIERMSFAPAISLISEIANGYQVIRAYKKADRFLDILQQRMNRYIKASLNGMALQRWISLRTDIFAALSIGAASIFGVLARNFNATSDPSLIGLSISWSLSITGIISFTVKILGDVELGMNSVERILQYANKTEREAEWEEPKPAIQPWPTQGEIKLEHLHYRYRDGLPLVIKDLNISIGKHEKIGVVGRTGSGKSTLTLGLLRILELVNENGLTGDIKIDGQSIGPKSLGLHQLRHKVTIIPQDPVLFNGSVKSNVDPFNEHKEEDIIEALKKVQIWDQIKFSDETKGEKEQKPEPKGAPKGKKKAPKEIEMTNYTEDQRKLYFEISDGGSNFSLGQRQLICMARAIIRRPKVLLMDEATASIDELTDHLLQKMIKTEFKETTVITIAHRLITIIQYDKILVLDQGKMVEFDSPLELMKKDGYFLGLIKEGGPDFEKKMREMAERKLDVIE